MKHFFAFWLLAGLWLPATPGWAQAPGLLTGITQDNKGQAIGFATVAVGPAGAKNSITGTVADENGRFQLQAPAAGTYVLQVGKRKFARITLAA